MINEEALKQTNSHKTGIDNAPDELYFRTKPSPCTGSHTTYPLPGSLCTNAIRTARPGAMGQDTRDPSRNVAEGYSS